MRVAQQVLIPLYNSLKLMTLLLQCLNNRLIISSLLGYIAANDKKEASNSGTHQIR